jgi:uncharacterized protein YodC (DUF2158 family)
MSIKTKFKIGDVVRLKSGSCPMTIESEPDSDNKVFCRYGCGKDINSIMINATMLVHNKSTLTVEENLDCTACCKDRFTIGDVVRLKIGSCRFIIFSEISENDDVLCLWYSFATSDIQQMRLFTNMLVLES